MRKNRIVLILLFFILGAGCSTQRALLTESRDLPSNVTGGEISRLKEGEVVTFAAILGKRENSCVEVFVPEEYRKYRGDGKWALSSRFAFDPPEIAEGTSVVVTGKVTFVRDSDDSRITCNIVTGNLFEIEDLGL